MINLNLLPPNLKTKRLENKKNASLIGFGLIIIFIFIILAIILQSLKETIKSSFGNLKNSASYDLTLSDQDKKNQEMALMINDRAKTLESIDKNRAIWSQIIQDLSISVPTDVQIENLTANISKSSNFVLTGNAPNEREIIKFKEKLEVSPFFKNVGFKSANTQNQSDQPASGQSQQLNFTLEFDLEKPNQNQ